MRCAINHLLGFVAKHLELAKNVCQEHTIGEFKLARTVPKYHRLDFAKVVFIPGLLTMDIASCFRSFLVNAVC